MSSLPRNGDRDLPALEHRTGARRLGRSPFSICQALPVQAERFPQGLLKVVSARSKTAAPDP